MKVLFDAYELGRGQGNSLGIYRYARSLFEHLQVLASPSFQIEVALHGDNEADFPLHSPHAQVRRVSERYPGRGRRLWWRQAGAAWGMRQARADVYFSPKGFLPRLPGNTCSVLVVHDLIPLWYDQAFPKHFSWAHRVMVNRGLMRACRRADRLITISAASRDDILRRSGRSEGVHVVANGLDAPVCAERSGPPGERYLFAVSSRLPHKNLVGLLQAYRAYRRSVAEPLPLKVCGVPDTGEPGVTSLGHLDEAALCAAYRDACAFVFLSLKEGFGFPPLEAMQHGVPVICSDIDALREVTAGRATLVDPADPEAVAAALRAATQSPPEHATAQAARKVAAGYRWDRCARGVHEVLCRAAAACAGETTARLNP